MHADGAHIDINHLIEVEPIKPAKQLGMLMWICVILGALTFTVGLFSHPREIFWGVFHVNLFFWTGLSVGGVIITAIVQIVRATWSAPIRRIAEANVSFLPWAYIAFLATYFGKEYIFPWASGPMPGRELWMQPNFVYLRFAILLGLLFFLMWRYVRLSLRGDIGLIREKAKNKNLWIGLGYDALIQGWKGSETEVVSLQRRLSWNAPLLIAVYAVIYSLYVFEMLMSMDVTWYSNLFGAFIFIGNIYLAWAVLAFTVICLNSYNKEFSKILNTQQLWDIGKLCFAFCMLWGYMFFSQFLPQWYGNMPEETQWMILRTREMPWKGVGWITFSMCFVLPFILLLSDDLKKAPKAFATVCCIIFFGIWLEKYSIVIPQVSPTHVPFDWLQVGMFLGFLGTYVLSVQSFMARYPFVAVSHPQLRGDVEW